MCHNNINIESWRKHFKNLDGTEEFNIENLNYSLETQHSLQ